MRTKPISDRIVVQFDDAPTTSDAGIILAPTPKHEHPHKTGTVLAVGPGKPNDRYSDRDAMQINVGDKIQFSGIAGVECPWDDLTNVMIITQEDVHFVMHD